MGQIEGFEKEKLIAGILTAASVPRTGVLEILEAEWGKIDYLSPEIPFDFTDYYNREMGEGILRSYLSFETLRSPGELGAVKNRSNSLETIYQKEGCRLVNIDPGFLSLNRLVLASSKDAGHRIPLTGGVFGEVTLVYQSGGFQTLGWTYPDYKSDFCRGEMVKIREIYKKQRRS